MDKPNIRAIQNVVHTDLQRRIFKQYNALKEEFNATDEDYDVQQTLLGSRVEQCNNMKDINELLTEYCDLFTSYDDLNVPTIDGTLNYVVGLLVKQCELHKQPV